MEKPLFAPDYQEGTHPEIMRRLCETYVLKSDGYGTDAFCNEACEKIRAACDCSNAGDSFLSGGTQANAIVIDADLRPWQCVVDAESGHIKTREAADIEFGGLKVVTLPLNSGNITVDAVRVLCESYCSERKRGHMVMSGMVYLSQPTEYGTLYSLDELSAIKGEYTREIDFGTVI